MNEHRFRTCAMRILLVAFISLAEAFLYPSSNQLIFRSADPAEFSRLESSKAAHPAHCDVGWAYYDETDSCYKNFFGLNFDDAERLCRTVGGHLTSIHTSTENSFVGELAKSGIAPEKCCELATWIGLTRPDIPNSNWTWTDGTEVDFLAWAPKQPDDFRGVERCTVLNSDAHANLTMALFFRKWEDAECSLTVRSFVCKKSALH
ncbi:unnamed protein product [Cylicocyclus nassatus]|uniref:C-type lectin domain-containing protein n=1 Tax=Cylicocyclus nassatus TaxID=53992 RepID=A0AA36H0I3_CYLNA|nr:unnamed protein product [Cylicocyclus nassatus]